MKWTKKCPKKEGFYWIKYFSNDGKPDVGWLIYDKAEKAWIVYQPQDDDEFLAKQVRLWSDEPLPHPEPMWIG